ncbi:hypothetical protein [Reichenbachiella sp. MALMAid0571]|uniref:hypothetical protein n=1 Tax=Reichenbachiella sp. MALMAid0571 TaxID=3143939 RepID=UPI0032DF484A
MKSDHKKRNKEFLITLRSNDNSNIELTQSWENFQRKMVKEFENGDPNEFLRFPTVQGTMFFSARQVQFIELKESRSWNHFRNAIVENSLGNPPIYKYYPRSSGNLVHHAYSLNKILQVIDIEEFLKLRSILEFGGGYGSFCRLVSNIGYRNQYTIYDLPVFNKIQKWYLSSVIDSAKIEYLTDSKLLSNRNPDSFIALWSLSESPMSLRKTFEPVIRSSKIVLIAFQKEFHGIDNWLYFNGLVDRGIVKNGKIFEIPSIPNNYYLLGTCRD